jgi:lysyl-tRNA synthetase class II
LEELFGKCEKGDWHQGIIQNLLEEIKKDNLSDAHWICIDGKISEPLARNVRRALNEMFKLFIGGNEFHLTKNVNILYLC